MKIYLLSITNILLVHCQEIIKIKKHKIPGSSAYNQTVYTAYFKDGTSESAYKYSFLDKKYSNSYLFLETANISRFPGTFLDNTHAQKMFDEFKNQYKLQNKRSIK